MLVKTFAYSLMKCLECQKWIIYKLVDGPPDICPRCGVPAGVSLSAEEKRKLENAQQNNERIFTFRT